jgi:hypothetical protein
MKRTITLISASALLTAAVCATGCSKSLNPRVRDSIATQMKMQRSGLARCYGKALKHNRRTRGRVTLAFTVSDKTGEFSNVRVAKTGVRDRKLVRCLTRRAMRLRADPKPERPVDVTFSVDFRPLEQRKRRRPEGAQAKEEAPPPVIR